ncbi:BglG family transcription antiterminator [uncultured Dubosiella sp.]|uniref:BglG family transcription antiterminator n=1 Tax=uncultured Dubosiella sp. TaxID=1937011 RepID=UPI00272F0A5A|nr:BglG family transcription antiterminator [uncultured Dubosiella sp.]
MEWIRKKTEDLLVYVLNLTASVSLNTMAEHFQVSRRTIYNEIEHANDWLKMNHLTSLEVNRGRLEPLKRKNREALREYFAKNVKTFYNITPTERIYLIVCLVLGKQDRILIADLLDMLQISRTSLLADLKATQSFLSRYDLVWKSNGRQGYTIEGDEVQRRALFLLLLSSLPNPIKQHYLFAPQQDSINAFFSRMRKVERALRQELIESDLYDLAKVMVSNDHEKPLVFEDMDVEKIKASPEFKEVNKEFEDLSLQEQIYLTLNFLGSRLVSFASTPFDEQDRELYALSGSLIYEFETRACVEFEERGRLQTALFHHIKASRYRYKYGIQIGSPLEKDIRNAYPEVFRITRETAGYLEQVLQVHISDAEVAYLALHFGAFLAIPPRDLKTLRIMIVCISGVGTANMIAREVRALLPQAEIVGIESLRSLSNPHMKADLIVSSVDFQALIPVLKVHPIFGEEDRTNLLNHPLVATSSRRGNAEALYAKIEDLVGKDQKSILKKRLEDYFSFYEKEQKLIESSNSLLIQLLKGNIRLYSKKVDWNHALDLAAEPLLQDGKITSSYVQTMKMKIEEHGTYMFVTEDVILAHARPQDGVNHLCLSLAMFDEPVLFLDRQAHFVFILGAVDQTSHFPVLEQLRKVFKKMENRKRVLNEKTIEGIVNQFEKILN